MVHYKALGLCQPFDLVHSIRQHEDLLRSPCARYHLCRGRGRRARIQGRLVSCVKRAYSNRMM